MYGSAEIARFASIMRCRAARGEVCEWKTRLNSPLRGELEQLSCGTVRYRMSRSLFTLCRIIFATDWSIIIFFFFFDID